MANATKANDTITSVELFIEYMSINTSSTHFEAVQILEYLNSKPPSPRRLGAFSHVVTMLPSNDIRLRGVHFIALNPLYVYVYVAYGGSMNVHVSADVRKCLRDVVPRVIKAPLKSTLNVYVKNAFKNDSPFYYGGIPDSLTENDTITYMRNCARAFVNPSSSAPLPEIFVKLILERLINLVYGDFNGDVSVTEKIYNSFEESFQKRLDFIKKGSYGEDVCTLYSTAGYENISSLSRRIAQALAVQCYDVDVVNFYLASYLVGLDDPLNRVAPGIENLIIETAANNKELHDDEVLVMNEETLDGIDIYSLSPVDVTAYINVSGEMYLFSRDDLKYAVEMKNNPHSPAFEIFSAKDLDKFQGIIERGRLENLDDSLPVADLLDSLKRHFSK